MGVLSPFLRTLPLEAHGLRWIRPAASVAHPLDGEPAVVLRRSLPDTARELGADADAYAQLLTPYLRDPHGLLADALAPLGLPRHPLRMLRFGLAGVRSATAFARAHFQGRRAQALFAGCAAHAILPLECAFTAAVGLLFALHRPRRRFRSRAGAPERTPRRSPVSCARMAAASTPACASARWPSCRRRASTCSTPARRSSPTLPSQFSRPATCAACGAIATDRACSSSTGRSTARSRGAIPAACRHRPCTSAAAWKRSPPPRPPSGAVSSERPFSHGRTAEPVRSRRRLKPPAMPTAITAGSTTDLTQVIGGEIDRFLRRIRRARILARHLYRPTDFRASANPTRTTVGGAITARRATRISCSPGRWRASIRTRRLVRACFSVGAADGARRARHVRILRGAQCPAPTRAPPDRVAPLIRNAAGHLERCLSAPPRLPGELDEPAADRRGDGAGTVFRAELAKTRAQAKLHRFHRVSDAHGDLLIRQPLSCQTDHLQLLRRQLGLRSGTPRAHQADDVRFAGSMNPGRPRPNESLARAGRRARLQYVALGAAAARFQRDGHKRPWAGDRACTPRAQRDQIGTMNSRHQIGDERTAAGLISATVSLPVRADHLQVGSRAM